MPLGSRRLLSGAAAAVVSAVLVGAAPATAASASGPRLGSLGRVAQRLTEELSNVAGAADVSVASAAATVLGSRRAMATSSGDGGPRHVRGHSDVNGSDRDGAHAGAAVGGRTHGGRNYVGSGGGAVATIPKRNGPFSNGKGGDSGVAAASAAVARRGIMNASNESSLRGAAARGLNRTATLFGAAANSNATGDVGAAAPAVAATTVGTNATSFAEAKMLGQAREVAAQGVIVVGGVAGQHGGAQRQPEVRVRRVASAGSARPWGLRQPEVERDQSVGSEGRALGLAAGANVSGDNGAAGAEPAMSTTAAPGTVAAAASSIVPSRPQPPSRHEPWEQRGARSRPKGLVSTNRNHAQQGAKPGGKPAPLEWQGCFFAACSWMRHPCSGGGADLAGRGASLDWPAATLSRTRPLAVETGSSLACKASTRRATAAA